MYFTPQEEEQIVERYRNFVNSVVFHFRKKCDSHIDNWEDLFQECMIVLIKSIRVVKNINGYTPPVRDMINAMCRYTLTEQTLTHPKRTTGYKKVINSAKSCIDLGTADKYACRNTEDSEARIMVDDFLETLTPEERMLVHLKLEGGTNRYAARISGLPELTVSRRIRGVYEKYKKYAAE